MSQDQVGAGLCRRRLPALPDGSPAPAPCVRPERRQLGRELPSPRRSLVKQQRRPGSVCPELPARVRAAKDGPLVL